MPSPLELFATQHRSVMDAIAQDVRRDPGADPFAWLRDPAYPNVRDPEILAYLAQENALVDHFKHFFRATYDELLDELKGRIHDEDQTVPVKIHHFFYQKRYHKGCEHPILARAPLDSPSAYVDLVDFNAMAENYLKCDAFFPSFDDRYIAMALDRTGDERYELWILDTINNRLWKELTNISPDFTWDFNKHSLYCTTLNKEWRATHVHYHTLGQPQSDDRLVLEEKDPRFSLKVGTTSDQRYVTLEARSKTSTEVYVIDATSPYSPMCLKTRHENHEYTIDHQGHHFYVLTNDQHRNFRLVKVDDSVALEQSEETKNKASFWEGEELLPSSDTDYLKAFHIINHTLVLEKKSHFQNHIVLMDLTTKIQRSVSFDESAYDVQSLASHDPQASFVRLRYSSLKQPQTVVDVDLQTSKKSVRKETVIPSGYASEDYTAERLFVTARDGTSIPLSILYKTSLRSSSMPLYLYGYGSYGYGMPTAFNRHRLSLLDRGYAFAIAHIRGGDEGGQQWHEDGRLDRKWNTFHDFIDCAKALIDQGFSQKGKIVCAGGSAGGMLMGVVINEAPELFAASVAHVPFVDVLNTMLDASLPLTPPEYLEWGNPADPSVRNILASYSPYDNVKAQSYPPLLVTAGLHDPRVTYWEPAKWVAKLRSTKTDDHLILLNTHMQAGHGGTSGRFAELEELALEYTFVLASNPS